MINVNDTIARLLAAFGLRSNETLFDPNYYRSTYADVAAAGVDPYEHYVNFGVAENRSPNAYFDTQYYLSQTRDRPRDPTQHYLLKGAAAGLDPHPSFETRWYLNAYPDVAGAGVNPLKHFLSHGRRENRETAPRFRQTFGRLSGFSRDRAVNNYKTFTFKMPGPTVAVDQPTNLVSIHLYDSYVVMTFATEAQRQALFTALNTMSGLQPQPLFFRSNAPEERSGVQKATSGEPMPGSRSTRMQAHREFEVSIKLSSDNAAHLPNLGLIFISAFVTNSAGKLFIDAAGVRLYFVDSMEVRLIRAFGPIRFIGSR